MRWQDMEVLGEVLDSRIILTQAEAKILAQAEALLGRIRKQLEVTYGVDEAEEIPLGEPWVYADSYLSEAMMQLARTPTYVGGSQIGPFPPRTEEP